MVFSSLLFIFFFLPTTLLIYFLSPIKIKNVVLLMTSLIFYAWGEPIYITLMIFSAIVDYFHGMIIDRNRKYRQWKAKAALFSSIVINISLLGFFKYADFLIHQINILLNTNIPPTDLPLPIGISFYTFQTMSYTIDVYRGVVKAQKNPITFATYVSLFPQLIAGPIVRYQRIQKQLFDRTITFGSFSNGVRIFIIGLGKKVLLANNIGLLWENIQNVNIEELTVFSAWLGILAYALQIYFDFSGYSDMAIGLGKMFGFSFPQNFNFPYLSKSITEFWRRWHMTLGRWFRDYVYIPLGGNRVSRRRHFLNLLIVWSLTGFWHGAYWNYILWGLYFGLLIIIERAFLIEWLVKMPSMIQRLYFFFSIMVSWVIFVFEDLTLTIHYLQLMFGFTKQPIFDSQFIYFGYTNLFLLIIAFISAFPIVSLIKKRFMLNRLVKTYMIPVLYVFILLLSTAYLVDESYNPFLYFRF